MPDIDVGDILSDPLFFDTFTVTRSRQTVSAGGMGIDTKQIFRNIGGVVCANDNLDLMIVPEGEHLIGSITIHTEFRLTDGKGQFDADMVTWNGRAYTVVSIGDWSRYGAGFIMAVASLNKLNPT